VEIPRLAMDLAAAALVRVAGRERIRRVFTVDRQDLEAALSVRPPLNPALIGGVGALLFLPISRMITSFAICVMNGGGGETWNLQT
jgi:hypothetical protein